MSSAKNRIAAIEIDDSALPPPTPEIEQERKVAMSAPKMARPRANFTSRWAPSARWSRITSRSAKAISTR